MSVKSDSEFSNSPNSDSKNFYIFCVFYLMISLSVFVLPSDMLSKYEICLKFVKFIKSALPAVEVFSAVSALP